MSGTNFDVSAWSYKHINIDGNGGADIADMYASTGADTFTGVGNVATLTSGNVDRKVTNVAQVIAHGNASSVAAFFGKQGVTNNFAASPAQASMSGTGFNNIAKGFGSAQAYAVPGSTDTATFGDSAGNDMLRDLAHRRADVRSRPRHFRLGLRQHHRHFQRRFRYGAVLRLDSRRTPTRPTAAT